jgi:uncharacterized surface anchored protein
MTLHRNSRRARPRWVALVGMVMVFSLMGVATTLASHSEVSLSGSNFEIDTDANLKQDDASPSIDWASVTEARRADLASGSGDNSFGQGTKEDTAIPSVVDGSIPPNKSDLKFFGLYQEGSTSNGFLNLYWSRVQDPSGTTNMDFEFNQSGTLSSNGVTPVRTAGDLLIIYDLSNGGTHPTLSKSTWNGSSWGNPVALNGTNSAGSINTSAIPAADADGLGAHSARTFGEAQLRLAAIFPDPTVCLSFGSAYLKSRSSDSFSSALKDFIAPQPVNVSNCGSINIHKQDDADGNLAGATFSLYKDNAPLGGSPPHGAEDTAVAGKTCTTAANGNCSITGILAGEYWVVETTTPAGYQTAADQHVTVTASDTPISLTFTDPRLRGSIKVVKTAKHADTSGNTSANLVATFTVSKGATSFGTITTNASGIGCLDGLVFDTYTVTETTVPTGYSAPAAQSAVVNSLASCPTGSVTKTFDNTPKTNITVSVDSQVAGGTNSTMVCKLGTTTVGSGSTATNGDGSLTVSDLAPGIYTCTIDIDP